MSYINKYIYYNIYNKKTTQTFKQESIYLNIFISICISKQM